MTAEDATEQIEESQRRRRRPRGRVTVFPNWCKGCNLCVEFCPTHVLEQGEDGRVIVAHPERCTACRWCELHCPDFAIFVQEISPEDEVSEVPSADDASLDDASMDGVSKIASREESA